MYNIISISTNEIRFNVQMTLDEGEVAPVLNARRIKQEKYFEIATKYPDYWSGGMGCIYLADDLRLDGRLCALKEVEHDRTMPTDLIKAGS